MHPPTTTHIPAWQPLKTAYILATVYPNFSTTRQSLMSVVKLVRYWKDLAKIYPIPYLIFLYLYLAAAVAYLIFLSFGHSWMDYYFFVIFYQAMDMTVLYGVNVVLSIFFAVLCLFWHCLISCLLQHCLLHSDFVLRIQNF